jgi:hypothetical protein
MRADGLSLLADISSITATANYYVQTPPNVPVQVMCLNVSADAMATNLTADLKRGVAGTTFFTAVNTAADTVVQSCDPVAGQSARVEAGTVIHVVATATGGNATAGHIQVWGRLLAR